MPECYMCKEPGTTREHVPPKSFHPEGYRDGLITVPSCEQHNLGNALDVEAVRNVIPISRQTNEVGLALFHGPIVRSFERSPGLTKQTLGDLQPIVLNGERGGVFTCDLTRLNQIVGSIAYGMYFHMFQHQFPYDWEVFMPGLIAKCTLVDGTADSWGELRQSLARQSYNDIVTPQPLVFRCGLYDAPDDILKVFRFTFYGGNIIYAFTKLRDASDANSPGVEVATA